MILYTHMYEKKREGLNVSKDLRLAMTCARK